MNYFQLFRSKTLTFLSIHMRAAMFLVQMDRMGQIAANYANVRTGLDVARTMATAFATRDGWEITVTMCALKDFMENIAWNSVRVRHRNSFVMQLVDAFVVWAMMVSIA